MSLFDDPRLRIDVQPVPRVCTLNLPSEHNRINQRAGADAQHASIIRERRRDLLKLVHDPVLKNGVSRVRRAGPYGKIKVISHV
jgi:hypothetical protein